MHPVPAAARFTDHNIELIAHSLRDVAKPHKIESLGRILREWGSTDLSEHLSRVSPKILAVKRKSLAAVASRAKELLHILEKLDDESEFAVALQMRPLPGQPYWALPPTELKRLQTRLVDERDFLRKLADAAPKALGSAKRGQPRNVVAYLVMLDVAAIFEWLTETEATRKRDATGGAYGEEGVDANPFWNFAAALWPVIFQNGDTGLQAAIKNWAYNVKKYRDRSALIANIAMSHPEWRLFDRN